LHEGDRPAYEIEARGGRVTIRGSTGVAMATGLGEYLKDRCLASISWAGDQLSLPSPLPDAPLTRRVAPSPHRYQFNYCTFSYSMAWWDWARWEREIDWMALAGIDMPLAVTGQEAIWRKVYRDLGLSDEEIAGFFVGPGYLPFGWMGCMDGWGGPLPLPA
jgi:alpha-N-acetylglucosaminidase